MASVIMNDDTSVDHHEHSWKGMGGKECREAGKLDS